MIGLRLKLALLVAAAFLLAMLGWRRAGIEGALARAKADAVQRRLDAVLKSEEIENEIEALPRDRLLDRSRKWVR